MGKFGLLGVNKVKTATVISKLNYTFKEVATNKGACLKSNGGKLHQLGGYDTLRSAPSISSRCPVEALQVLFALVDILVIFLAVALVCPTTSPLFLMVSVAGSVFFILGKALMRGYSRRSLA
jgi:hypothetical protein